MALQQWELYESMSVLNDSGTAIRSVPETVQRGAADGRTDGNGAKDGNGQQRPADGGNNGWQSAEEPQRSAAKKRPAAAAAAANEPANGSVDRRVTKKMNVVNENWNEDGRGEDECQQFLSSLLPYLCDVPKHRKLTVRHKLQKVFIDELEKHGDHQHAASNADQPPPPPPPPLPPPPAARGPPPPYPHKNEFGGYVPPQHVYAGKPPAAVDCPPKPQLAYGKHEQRVSPQPAAGKCASDVPLLNIDYSASTKPTVYYNSKAFADFPAARDMLFYGRAADATPTPANVDFPDAYTTAAVAVNPADAADDNPWTYSII